MYHGYILIFRSAQHFLPADYVCHKPAFLSPDSVSFLLCPLLYFHSIRLSISSCHQNKNMSMHLKPFIISLRFPLIPAYTYQIVPLYMDLLNRFLPFYLSFSSSILSRSTKNEISLIFSEVSSKPKIILSI